MRLFDWWMVYVIGFGFTFGTWILERVDRRFGLGPAILALLAATPLIFAITLVSMPIGLIGLPLVAVAAGFVQDAEDRRRRV